MRDRSPARNRGPHAAASSGSQRRWMKRVAVLTAAAVGPLIVLGSQPPTSRVIDGAPDGGRIVESTYLDGRFMRGAYDKAIYRPQTTGQVPRIDIEATLQALKQANVDTYAYLICPDEAGNPAVSRTQFEDFPRFAAEAKRLGINVYAYLVPPTEAPEKAYEPFGWDYSAWARGIAKMAAANPTIRGIMIDDFGGNTFARPSSLFVFTPEYVSSMMQAARQEAPWLAFIPILYHHDIVGPRAVLSDYRSLAQGVVFPYHGASDGHTEPGNTKDPSLALLHGQEVGKLLQCQGPTPCSQVVFPSRTPRDRTIDTATVSGTIQLAAGREHSLSFEIENNLVAGAASDYVVQVSIDEKTVLEAGQTKSRKPYLLKLYASRQDESLSVDVDLEIQIRRSPSALRRRLVLNLDNIQIVSEPAPTRVHQFRLVSSAGVQAKKIQSLPLIYMTYAIPLKAEKGIGASPKYVSRILGDIDKLKQQGLVGGSLVFKVPLPQFAMSRPANYDLVRQAYANW